jgi:membrane protein DedA with SNARE-associated domain
MQTELLNPAEWLRFFSGSGGVVLFVIIFVEQAGLPIPAAPWLLAAGVTCATGETSPIGVIGITAVACLIPDLVWFYLGRRGGGQVLRFLSRLALPGALSVARIERSFFHQGMPLVLVSKFVTGLNLMVPPLAGALGVGRFRFLLFDLLSSVLYAAVYLLLGAVFSEQIKAVLDAIKQLEHSALLLLLAAIVGYLVRKHGPWRKPSVRSSEQQESQRQQIRQPLSVC